MEDMFGFTCHKDVEGCRVPSRIVSPLWVTVAFVLVNVAVHPWSQNCPIDKRLPVARVGNKWTAVAGAGS